MGGRLAASPEAPTVELWALVLGVFVSMVVARGVRQCPEDGCRRKLTVGEIKSILGPTMSAQFAR